MSYQYLVKIFRWENGTVYVSNIEFSSEEESIAYSKSIGGKPLKYTLKMKYCIQLQKQKKHTHKY